MASIKKILIANRGEIALRIMRTCKQLGIRTVAAFSEADKDALFVQFADEAVCIGPPASAESYLSFEKILGAAKETGADAIHPGYGFLSENASFAQACADAGLIFIGPPVAAIEKMGSKSIAKHVMRENGVPVVPGYTGDEQDAATLAAQADKIGYPVLLKASAGGGGKGMRVVRDPSKFEESLESAKREAMSSFGDEKMILEKYFDSVRHVEFQIFGDQHGNQLHLLERECSVQRRHQKIIEESPSSFLNEELRAKMGEAAVLAAKAIGYYNAGTVEFIVAPDKSFYFLEVNTRLQVEHPVTEMVTGLDLVKLQIEVAEGKALEIQQEDISHNGYAIECRIYAEDPDQDFRPQTGVISDWHLEEMQGLRVDTGVQENSEISIYYDPMIAKVIAHASDRASGIRKMRNFLASSTIMGLVNNKSFLIKILDDEVFFKGDADTHYIDNNIERLKEHAERDTDVRNALIAATLQAWSQREQQRNELKHLPSGWRNNFYQGQLLSYTVDSERFDLEYRCKGSGFSFKIGEETLELNEISIDGGQVSWLSNDLRKVFRVSRNGEKIETDNLNGIVIRFMENPRFPDAEAESNAGNYMSPMPGQILRVLVKDGDEVSAGQGLLVIHSMKMENTISAAEDGIVESVMVEEGSLVEADTLLIKMKAKEE